jgi:hypothetical protein
MMQILLVQSLEHKCPPPCLRGREQSQSVPVADMLLGRQLPCAYEEEGRSRSDIWTAVPCSSWTRLDEAVRIAQLCRWEAPCLGS